MWSSRFQLFYFSNTVTKEKRETVLVVDTRTSKKTFRSQDADEMPDEDPIEMAIQTK